MENPTETLNRIFINLIRKLYTGLGQVDFSNPMEAVLKFDEEQRISSFNNLKINGEPKIPSFDLAEELNEISTEIFDLPMKFHLESLDINVQEGGEMDIHPHYRESE